MRKRIKFKSNKVSQELNDGLETKNHVVQFWIAILLLFLCAVFHSFLFYSSFFRAIYKLNEKPIATITFKYKTAQRKFLARNVWDRLSQHSPVYNGDTIHTGALSQATIWFNDGNSMELNENTMAQVFLNDELGASAELNGGSAMFDTSGSQKGMTVKSGGVQIQVESGSSLSAGYSDDSYSGGATFFQMLAGSARIFSEENQTNLAQGQSVNFENNSQFVEPVVTLLNPPPNQKLLYHKEGGLVVDFNWKVANAPSEKTPALLVVATDKKFQNVVQEKEIDLAGLSFCQMELAPQTYYWKFSGIAGATPSGKFQVIQALPPKLVSPVQDYSYSYKDKSPAVRLIWEQVPSATSYFLEIADNPNFSKPIIEQRNSSASSIVSTLSNGEYFWRVTPFFTINKTGYAATSQTGSFKIQKKNTMRSPRLLTPLPGAVVNTDPSAGAIIFSWKTETDAERYTLIVSENQDLSNPFISQDVLENHCRIQDIASRVKDGKWYWTVTSRDAYGNVSPIENVQTVYGMPGKSEQHTIEPANGYKVSQSLLADMRFTWKKNIPEYFESKIEIALDSGFNKIIHSQKVIGSSAAVKWLPIGAYYWRLKSTGGDVVLETMPKLLNVVDNLEAPVVVSPVEKMVVREGVPAEFKWNAVQDADYYKFTIFSADGTRVLYTDTVYSTSVELDMLGGGTFSDRTNYKMQVQAFAFDVPGVSTRRTGMLSNNDFMLRKLRPIQVEFPTEGMTIDGLEAITQPKSARWYADDTLSEAQFVLSKIEDEEAIDVIKYPSDKAFAAGQKVAPNSILLDTKDGLRPGKYQIVVYAKTLDGIDISNTSPEFKRTFTVSPIPKLEAPKNLRANPENFDEKYLTQKDAKRIILLEWEKVPNATEYKLNVFKDKELVLKKTVLKNSYAIDFMALGQDERILFSQGKFTWQVEAVRRIDSDGDGVLDKVFQDGAMETGKFKTNVPVPKSAQVKGAVNPYAK